LYDWSLKYLKQDFNITAKHNINMIAEEGDFNVKVGGSQQVYVAGDSNLTVDKNYNLKVDGSGKITTNAGLDVKVTGSTKINTIGNLDLLTTGSNKFTATGSTDIKSGGNHTETAAEIHMNGPEATPASAALDALSYTAQGLEIRTPLVEPWAGHENLHEPKSNWNNTAYTPKYTTTTDTFKKVSK
jgi:hypothetical protein